MNGRIAIVGATGLVGAKLLEIARNAAIPGDQLGLFASSASAGQPVLYRDTELVVEDLAECNFGSFRGVFFCIGDELSASYVPQALDAGCLVVDKSNAFRMNPEVPLVVAGVNDAAVNGESRLAANPNCTTIVLCHALAPLAAAFGLKSVWTASYQSVSGAGRDAATGLIEESAQLIESYGGAPAQPGNPESTGFNVLPAIGSMDEAGRCSEEAKLINETRKILSARALPVTAHTVRVPVTVGHAVAVTVELDTAASTTELQAKWRDAADIRFMESGLPTPAGSAQHDQVEVGRLRQEDAAGKLFSFFACGDNINIAAALNGWRIYRLLAAAFQ
jgi:aspartate-semialdehyde dehydrogenase